jgi:drug/metabolite transporter (DMT)-like permease
LAIKSLLDRPLRLKGTDQMNRFNKGAVYIFISAVCFSILPVLAVYAYKDGTNVITLLVVRFFLASLFFFSFIMFRRVKLDVSIGKLVKLFILGGVCFAFLSIFYFSAVKYIPASMAALILYTYPAMVALVSTMVFKERLRMQTVIPIILSFIGLAMVLGSSFNKTDYRGILFALGSAIVYSIYIILGSRYIKEMSPVVVSAFVVLFAGSILLIAGLFTGTIIFDFGISGWLSIIGITAFSTILGIFFFLRGLGMAGSTNASVLSMVEPVFTVILSVILFHEGFTWLQVIGGAAVISGAMLVVSLKK